MPDNQTNIPGPRVPLIDSRSGLITREWYTFLSGLFSNTGGVSGVDGDKGDITVSGGTWTIDPGVVTTIKLGGDITNAGKALLDDADAAAQRETLGLGDLATANSGDYLPIAGGTLTDSLIVTNTLTSYGSITLRGIGDSTDALITANSDPTFNALFVSRIDDAKRSVFGYFGTDDSADIRLYDTDGDNEQVGLSLVYGGSAKLYYAGSLKLATVSDGVDVTGILDASVDLEIGGVSLSDIFLKEAFPVGSCYINTTAIDPALELGYGSWLLLGELTSVVAV